MKNIKTFTCLLGLLLCLWASVGVAEGLTMENAEFFPVDLAQCTEKAPFILTEDHWGHVYIDQNWDTWRYFHITAPADGTFYFSLKNTESKSGIDFDIYKTATGEGVWGYRVTDSTVAPVMAQTGEKFTFRVRTQGGTIIYLFSVCFDGFHKASDEAEIVRYTTCNQEGEILYRCELCGQPAIVETIPKPEHTLGVWEAVQFSTCGQEGLDVQRCTVCGDVVNSITYDKFDHAETETVTTQEANCMQTGLIVTRCSECHETFASDELPITDHVPGKMNVLREATCTASGRAQQRCTVCNTLLSDETQPALGHRFSKWETTQIPTSNQDGIRSRTCTVCNYVETETVSGLIIIVE